MRLKFGYNEPIRELGAPTRQRFKRTRKRNYEMRHGVEATRGRSGFDPKGSWEHPRRSAPRAGGARRAARIAGKEQLAACTYCNATARAGILYRRKECPQALFFCGSAHRARAPAPPRRAPARADLLNETNVKWLLANIYARAPRGPGSALSIAGGLLALCLRDS